MILFASLSSFRWMPHRNFHPPGGDSALLQLKDCVSRRQAAATPFPVVWYFCSIQLHQLRTGANSAWQLVIANSYSTARDHSGVTCGCCVFGCSQHISKNCKWSANFWSWGLPLFDPPDMHLLWIVEHLLLFEETTQFPRSISIGPVVDFGTCQRVDLFRMDLKA